MSLKKSVGLINSDSVLFLLKLTFLLYKNHGLLTLKRHNFFQNKNHKKAKNSFAR